MSKTKNFLFFFASQVSPKSLGFSSLGDALTCTFVFLQFIPFSDSKVAVMDKFKPYTLKPKDAN